MLSRDILRELWAMCNGPPGVSVWSVLPPLIAVYCRARAKSILFWACPVKLTFANVLDPVTLYSIIPVSMYSALDVELEKLVSIHPNLNRNPPANT